MSPLAPARQRLIQIMRATLADEAARHDWTYHAVRPCPVPAAWHPGQRVIGDCSKGVQFTCRWADAPDPMQNGWGVNGNSQTIWLKLHHVFFPAELAPGDIVVFGRDGADHAAMVLEAGPDPLLWSFGHQGAPNTYRLSRDRRVRTFCKLPIVPPPPTPQDTLRAHTDFYSWMAWSLGEGPWKHYGPSNPSVRPNVGRVIAVSHPTWWKRRIVFLANRNKGDKATTS
jgi:hypothetical protein